MHITPPTAVDVRSDDAPRLPRHTDHGSQKSLLEGEVADGLGQKQAQRQSPIQRALPAGVAVRPLKQALAVQTALAEINGTKGFGGMGGRSGRHVRDLKFGEPAASEERRAV